MSGHRGWKRCQVKRECLQMGFIKCEILEECKISSCIVMGRVLNEDE